jgi:hypothetical protein
MDPQEVLDCMMEIPQTVRKACEGLPPGVVALNIAKAVQELAEIVEGGKG